MDFLCNLISELMQDNTFLDHKINTPICMLKYAQRQLQCVISEVELTVQLSVKRMLKPTADTPYYRPESGIL